MGSRVLLPIWRKEVAYQSRALKGLTLSQLQKALRGPYSIKAKLRDPPGIPLSYAQIDTQLSWVAGAALALALYDQGWKLRALPGQLELCHHRTIITPFSVVQSLHDGEMTDDQWLQLCTESRNLRSFSWLGAVGFEGPVLARLLTTTTSRFSSRHESFPSYSSLKSFEIVELALAALLKKPLAAAVPGTTISARWRFCEQPKLPFVSRAVHVHSVRAPRRLDSEQCGIRHLPYRFREGRQHEFY